LTMYELDSRNDSLIAFTRIKKTTGRGKEKRKLN